MLPRDWLSEPNTPSLPTTMKFRTAPPMHFDWGFSGCRASADWMGRGARAAGPGRLGAVCLGFPLAVGVNYGQRTRAVFDRYNITSTDDLHEAEQRQNQYVRGAIVQTLSKQGEFEGSGGRVKSSLVH